MATDMEALAEGMGLSELKLKTKIPFSVYSWLEQLSLYMQCVRANYKQSLNKLALEDLCIIKNYKNNKTESKKSTAEERR